MSCTRPAAAAALVAMLSGCGGGGTSGGSSYESLLLTYSDLRARTPGTATDPANLPQSGIAQYSGAATYALDNSGTTIASAVDLSVSFGAGQTVTGALSDFYLRLDDGTVVPLSGTLSLSPAGSGFLAGTNEFALKPQGTISTSGFSMVFDEAQALPGNLIGEFRGPDGQFVTGPVQIGGFINGVPLLRLLTGDFYAERD
jgi:hypothetical protein